MRDSSLPFHDRSEAGRALAVELAGLRADRPVVLALPRGGVPVAEPVARALGAPLEALIVRKIGAPGNEEFGIGAMVEGGRFWLDEATVARLGIEPGTLERRLARTSAQVREYLRRYRAGRPLPDVRGRTVLLVDDGLATGVTARAALRYLREERGAGRVLLAVPVGSPATLAELARDFDGLVCLRAPADFRSVGQAYEDFAPVADDEVRALLGRRPRHPPGPPAR